MSLNKHLPLYIHTMDDFFDQVKKEEEKERKAAERKKKIPVFEAGKKAGAKKSKGQKLPSRLERFKKLKGISKAGSKLSKVPPKDPDRPSEFIPKADVVHQADLLFLPNDDGYRYLLVVVDVATRLTDAVPKKEKTQKATIKGFKKIYSRPSKTRILDKPIAMQTDAGVEFVGNTARAFFKAEGIALRVGKPGRSRQQAMVESHNGQITQLITLRQNEEELITGEPSREWIADIPLILELLNEDLGRTPPSETDVGDEPVCSKSEAWKKKAKGKRAKEMPTCDLLPKGTKVRAILDKPVSLADGKKLIGTFRVGDSRWETTVRTVVQQILKPGNPPLYLVSDRKNVAYTRAQLQVVDEAESQPSATSKAQVRFIAESILKDKMVGRGKKRGKQYLVQWKDPTGEFKKAGTDTSWEPADKVIADVPTIVEAYEKGKKKKKKK